MDATDADPEARGRRRRVWQPHRHEFPDAFGREGVQQCLRALAGKPLAAVADGILRAMNTFGDGAPQHDDVTMVLLRRRATA